MHWTSHADEVKQHLQASLCAGDFLGVTASLVYIPESRPHWFGLETKVNYVDCTEGLHCSLTKGWRPVSPACLSKCRASRHVYLGMDYGSFNLPIHCCWTWMEQVSWSDWHDDSRVNSDFEKQLHIDTLTLPVININVTEGRDIWEACSGTS